MRPSIDEWLAAVRWTIEEALLPEVSGPYARFQGMIALDLLDLIGRHWATRIADLTADAQDLGRALEATLHQAPEAVDPALRAAISTALDAPSLLPPLPHDDLARRVDHLAGLADAALAALADRETAGSAAAQDALRAAMKAQLARVLERQAGIDIRR